jgi:hypothetical protein
LVLEPRPSRLAGAAGAALLLVLLAAPACTQHRSQRPTAEESLPPSTSHADPDLPEKRSSGWPYEEQLGTALLIVALLAAAAGAAYLSFVVIPDAIH